MNRGFTLIEVLVALGVLSVGVIALLKVQGESAAATTAVRERLLAEIVAENLAVDAVSQPTPPEPGVTTGETSMAGKPWRWTRTIAPTADREITRVEVAVKTADTETTAASLVAFRGSR